MNRNYDDFRRFTCTTRIKEYRDGYYSFDDTVFYGEKGGMLADEGNINGSKVIELKWDDDILWHKVEGELKDPIMMEVDRDVRYVNTTVQSALHILDGYYAEMGLVIVAIGVHPDNQWYEVNSKDLPENHLDDVQKHISDAIRAEQPVTFAYMKGKDYPDEHYHQFDELRIVEIGDFDRQPCGTMHVSNTSQIGNFIILDSEKTSRGTKVYFTCNQVTETRMKGYHHILKNLSKMLSAGNTEIEEKVTALLDNNRRMKKEAEELKKEIATYKGREVLADDSIIRELEIRDPSEIRTIGQTIMNLVSGTRILYGEIENEINFAIISSDNKARDILESLKDRFSITGGGSPKMVTAKTVSDKQDFEKTIQELLRNDTEKLL